MSIDKTTGRNSDDFTPKQLDKSEKLKQQILAEIQTFKVNDMVKKSIALLLTNELTKFSPEIYKEFYGFLLLIKKSPELQKLLDQFAPFIFMMIVNIDASSRMATQANSQIRTRTRDDILNTPYGLL